MQEVMSQMQKAYRLGCKICVDESMIKYKGKYVRFVQYMPAKPIKHGIKVFALCCSYTGYLYSYIIYTGKDNVEGLHTSVDVVKQLIELAGCTGVLGRILFTDNYYTSLEVMKFLLCTYGMLMVGTYALTNKKSRTGSDFPFAKLSNKALKSIPRGWSRSAMQTIYKSTRSQTVWFRMQATIWKDKKLVGFLHNYLVQPMSEGFHVLRFSPRSRKRKPVRSPEVGGEYSLHMNGVDNKDRDTADWTVSLKSGRFYMRIFYWVFDGVLHGMYVIVRFVVVGDKEAAKLDPWYRYKHMDRGTGRFEFQMDLGIALINKGVMMDWVDPNDPNRERPSYVRKSGWIPCACGTCVFCKYKLTTGIDHATILKSGKKQRRSVTLDNNPKECSGEWEIMNKKGNARRCKLCIDRVNSRDPHSPSLSKKERRKLIKESRKGCRVCKVYVCKDCWDSFDHSNGE